MAGEISDADEDNIEDVELPLGDTREVEEGDKAMASLETFILACSKLCAISQYKESSFTLLRIQIGLNCNDIDR